MKNYMSRRAIAWQLDTTFWRVDQAIKDQGVGTCGCDRLCYDLDEAKEALGRMDAEDAEKQKEATLAVTALRERAGDEVLLRWAESFLEPLLRTVKRLR